MQIKKYKARTVAEAMARVKQDLGPEAMVLATRKSNSPTGGGVREVEITAASSEADFSTVDPDAMQGVRAELMNIKEMIGLINHSGSLVEQLVAQPALLSLYATMIRSGIEERYARRFMESGQSLPVAGPAADGRDVKTQIIKNMMAAIRVENPFDFNGSKRIVAAFVGTTGVGKTTTVAKLAAQLMLQQQKKVGLISIDNYRIGAVEQLKTYANILGVPCHPAFDRRDLEAALVRMSDRDAVLIDTAGQSQYDTARLTELKEMIRGEYRIATHLLLNVGAAQGEMNDTAVNFSPLNYESYIFTKIDEAKHCGSVINQSMRRQLPISYITTGQNVPEDIEPGSKRRIFNLVFNRN